MIILLPTPAPPLYTLMSVQQHTPQQPVQSSFSALLSCDHTSLHTSLDYARDVQMCSAGMTMQYSHMPPHTHTYTHLECGTGVHCWHDHAALTQFNSQPSAITPHTHLECGTSSTCAACAPPCLWLCPWSRPACRPNPVSQL